MIQASIAPAELQVDRTAELTVRLTNVGLWTCTNLVFRLALPVQVVLLRGSDRIEVPQLEAGASATSILRVKPLRAGTWTLTSPNFSYQDPRGVTRRVEDLRLELHAVPATSPPPPPPPEPRPRRRDREGAFICYRREDSKVRAGWLSDLLARLLAPWPVFIDMESIDVGVDFEEAIASAIDSCAVLLPVIGPAWASITDAQGRRRLDDPDDLVRLEIATALEHGTPVIPVLVEAASMPPARDLPAGIAALARRNAFLVHDPPQFKRDVAELARLIRHQVGQRPPGGPQ